MFFYVSFFFLQKCSLCALVRAIDEAHFPFFPFFPAALMKEIIIDLEGKYWLEQDQFHILVP